MRLRNVKNKEKILNGSKYLIKNPEEYIGKMKNVISLLTIIKYIYTFFKQNHHFHAVFDIFSNRLISNKKRHKYHLFFRLIDIPVITVRFKPENIFFCNHISAVFQPDSHFSFKYRYILSRFLSMAS